MAHGRNVYVSGVKLARSSIGTKLLTTPTGMGYPRQSQVRISKTEFCRARRSGPAR